MTPRAASATAALALSTSLLLGTAPGPADAQREPADRTITAEERTQAIDGILKALNAGYVFPETAAKMEAAVRERVQKKEYDAITSGRKLAETLTTHLQEVSRDKHLRVQHSARALPPAGEGGPSPEEVAGFRRHLQARNFGFQKVERLRGNVGYVSLWAFIEPDIAGDTAAAAMSFLAHTEALIFDLRENGGGDPAMVALLCSYLFPSEPVHLNSLYWREGDRTQQYWTLPYVPGKRYLEKKVYVLTSKRTFSGAEEFTYNLKNLKRATIIGETTGGGAHPGGTRRVSDHFSVWVPSGRAINPITKTNWEGTGVTPDVAVPADQALATAHVMALKHRIEKTTDSDERDALESALREAEKELDAVKKKGSSTE